MRTSASAYSSNFSVCLTSRTQCPSVDGQDVHQTFLQADFLAVALDDGADHRLTVRCVDYAAALRFGMGDDDAIVYHRHRGLSGRAEATSDGASCS